MYISADESDYVRVGNMMFPTDASGYGYASAEEISRRTKQKYEAELAAKAAEEKRLAEAEKGRLIYKTVFADLDESLAPDDQLDHIFEILVPGQGQCDNLGGELVRGMMRVLYRDYNDGDLFYEGYGLETCASDAAFVMDNTDDDIYGMMFAIAEGGLEGDEYTDSLNRVAGKLIEYLKNHPEVFGQDTEDCRSYESNTIKEIEEAAPKYEYEIEISDRISDHIDANHIDWDDVYNQVSSWAEYDLGGYARHWALDGITIEDLDREQLSQWEDRYWKWLDDWADELDGEYPLEEEDEDEEDEYDDEDDDEEM